MAETDSVAIAPTSEPPTPPPPLPLIALRAAVNDARSTVAWWVMVAAIAGVVLISMAEIDRLVAAVVAPKSGESHSLSSVIGPLSFLGRDAWAAWASSPFSHRVGWWVISSALLDVAFVLCYATAIYRFAKWCLPEGHPRPKQLAIAIAVVEGAEFVVLVAMGAALWFGEPWTPWPEVVAALAKWAVIVCIFVILLRTDATRAALGQAARRGWQALWSHRLSAVPVALIAVLACVPAEGVLDQLPDVQRQWLGLNFVWYFACAFVSIVVACIAAFALGRARTRRTVFRFVLGATTAPRTTVSVMKWWAIPVCAWVVVAGIAFVSHIARPDTARALADGDLEILWGPFSWGAAVFVGIPVAVVLLSLLLERWDWPEDDRPPDPPRAFFAWLAGDVLAIALLVVGGLGLVRSMVLPTVLGLGGDDVPFLVRTICVLLLGVLVAVGTPWLITALGTPGAPLLRWLISRNDPITPRTPPDSPTATVLSEFAQAAAVAAPLSEPNPGAASDGSASDDSPSDNDATATDDGTVAGAQIQPAEDPASADWQHHQRWQFGIIAAGGVILLVLAIAPDFAGTIGPVATTVLAVTAWTAVLGAFAVALQEYQPLALFRALRLKATPVLTLALTIPLIYGATFSALSLDGRMHEIRTLPPDRQNSLVGAESISVRLAENDCQLKVGDSVISPVLLVAAEGGGIRAAYWTGRAMEELTSTGCLSTSVLVASGISGGSVGLTLAGQDSTESMTDRLKKLASPHTLSTAVSGLLVGDAVAAATGVKLPSNVDPPPGFDAEAGADTFGWQWRDRAALIESGWISQVHDLAKPYSPTAGTGTGFVLLNSTDVDSGCRVIVGSHALATSLGTAVAAGTNERCEKPTSQPAVSWWLRPDCRKLIDTATAMMLSARFPVVTPGGRLPDEKGCDGSAQLVDGGYAEGTGLGTLADIAPQITTMLREENKDRAVPYVPVVVYLRNSGGFDVVKSLSEVTAEPLVPLVGYAAKATQLTDAAWLQRLSGSLSAVCPPMPEPQGDQSVVDTCADAVTATRAALSGQTVVISPATRPAVVPPLGWALSEMSVQSMEQALDAEQTCPRRSSNLRPVRLCTLAELTVVGSSGGGAG